MNKINKYALSFLFTFIMFIVFLLIINGLFYFNLINEAIYRFFKIFIVMISIFSGSFILGSKCENKGYLNGLIFGLIIILFLFILCIIFKQIQLKIFIYYLIILCSSMLGGTIGIRKKKTN